MKTHNQGTLNNQQESFRNRRRPSQPASDLEPNENGCASGVPAGVSPSSNFGTDMVTAAAEAGRGGRRNVTVNDRLSLDAVVSAETSGGLTPNGAEERHSVAATAESGRGGGSPLRSDMECATPMTSRSYNRSPVKSSRYNPPLSFRSVSITGGTGTGGEDVGTAMMLRRSNSSITSKKKVHCGGSGSGHASPTTTTSMHSCTSTKEEGAGRGGGGGTASNMDSVDVREDKSRGTQRRMTMTWESFLARHTEAYDGREGEEGEEWEDANGGEGGVEEASPMMRIHPRIRVQRQRRLPESPDPPYANRYPLQIPESLTGSSSWMEGDHLARQEEAEAEEEGDGEGSVPREPATEDIDMAVSLPRNLNDLGLQIPSRPSDIDVTSRAHSLSPKGVQQIHDIRIGPDGVTLCPSSLHELGMADGFSKRNRSWGTRTSVSTKIEDDMAKCVSALRGQEKKEKVGVTKFNMNPKEGLNFLVEEGIIQDTPESICDFLSTVGGLSKRRLGEYFGRDNKVSQKVLSLFLKNLHFNSLTLDEALRAMVLQFRMPGEAQQIDRIMERFSERYHEENPGIFSCSQTAYILAFSLMMLNTDMYNRNLRENEKMTQSQFVSNNREIDQGRDLPRQDLEAMYQRVKAAEIRMDEGDMFESEVIAFVAPKKSGWLKKRGKTYMKKWNKYWFVLADTVLYYFLTPQHQDEAPRCIIPLEGPVGMPISIDPVGTTDLSISVQNHSGYVKSVKLADNGQMEQGQHRAFVFRAETRIDRDEWVSALRGEVPQSSLDPMTVHSSASTAGSRSMSYSRSLSATPATSSVATPFGTPSDNGRRMSKFGNLPGRKRRSSFEVTNGNAMHPPVIRGWARTSTDRQPSLGRRYVALFRSSDAEDTLHFFGDPVMCDKMVSQGLPTSHDCVHLSAVQAVQVRQEATEGGGCAIVLLIGADAQAGANSSSKSEESAKSYIIVPEGQREVSCWMSHINACCPVEAQRVTVAESTPFSSVGGETTFLSNATLEEHEQDASLSGDAVAELRGSSLLRVANSSEAASMGLATVTSGLGHSANSEGSDAADSFCGDGDRRRGRASSAVAVAAKISADAETFDEGSGSVRRAGDKGVTNSGGGEVTGVDFDRAESNDTQSPGACGPDDGSSSLSSSTTRDITRALPRLGTEAEPDVSRLELGRDGGDGGDGGDAPAAAAVPGSPHSGRSGRSGGSRQSAESAVDVVVASRPRSIREDSTTGTDVE